MPGAPSLATRPDAPARHAALFHALSDPTRLRILDLLRSGERCVCELQEAMEAGQSLLSFHLKTLRDAGLVTHRKEGRWAHYALSETGLRHAEGVVAAFRQPRHRPLPVKCC